MSLAKRGSIITQDSMTRRERALQHQKGSKVTMGAGIPEASEGTTGDISVRTVADGIRCYLKTNSGWQDVNTMIPATKLIWHEMVLENSWVIFSTAYYKPAYTKDANGFVHFRGVVKDGSAINSIITTLPSTFRPDKNQLIAGSSDDSSGAGVQVQITTTGEVKAAYNGSTTLTSLDGISFYAGEVIVAATSSGGGSSGGGFAGGGGGAG